MLYNSLMLVSSILMTEHGTKRLDALGKQHANQGPLYDIVQNSLPNLSAYDKVIDYFPIFLGVIVLYLTCTCHPLLDLNLLFRDIFILVFLRLLMCSVTILPSSICKIKKAEAIGGCHDCIFSGHSSISLLLSYYIFKCFPDDVTKYSLLLYNIVCGVAIIATRNHYTIDVLVAWLAVFALKSPHS